MLVRVKPPSSIGGGLHARAAVVLATSVALAGCGSASSSVTRAEAPPKSCAATVLDTLGRVLGRVYREGVLSERTGAARHLIAASLPLRRAVEEGNAAAAQAAASELVATGHMTNLRVVRGGQTLASVGGPAVTPLTGAIAGAQGSPIASYVTSVWSDEGLIAEGSGVAQGKVVLRSGTRQIAGTPRLPAVRLAREGTLSIAGVNYQYTSFHGGLYPQGAATVYLLRPVASTRSLCGANATETQVNTLKRIAELIYAGEAGRRTQTQIRRVQRDQPLLQAVARQDPVASKAAVEALLVQHLVRLRVYDRQGRLLVDDGGPYVLAPVTAPLTLGGRRIGSIVLSIQDDEGYKRLTGRLAGLHVLMYIGSPAQLVKNSLGPEPGNVPASGPYTYNGRAFQVFTLTRAAFPSGPLTIRVLVPMPYT